jgi:HPt (histidine-containing phosphotransfer) domain-containing protein
MEHPNTSYIDALSGGDESFKLKLISILKEELPEEIKTYNKNIGLKYFKEAAENVHKLKHKMSILGLEASYELAVNYEENLKLGALNLREDFEAILEEMIRFINTL